MVWLIIPLVVAGLLVFVANAVLGMVILCLAIVACGVVVLMEKPDG